MSIALQEQPILRFSTSGLSSKRKNHLCPTIHSALIAEQKKYRQHFLDMARHHAPESSAPPLWPPSDEVLLNLTYRESEKREQTDMQKTYAVQARLRSSEERP
jgi:hypothetical protein